MRDGFYSSPFSRLVGVGENFIIAPQPQETPEERRKKVLKDRRSSVF